ncbi:MAG: cytochrome c maturation protein CcmE [Gammaproteobacteria bacterium]
MKARQRRLIFVGLAVVVVGIAATLVVQALRSNMNYFFTPEQVLAGEAPKDAVFRVGGMVEKGSLKRGKDLDVSFDVAINDATLKVHYTGILPDLFGEGQGVVARGRLAEDGRFVAQEVLAKHDEDYVAPEIADAMKKAEAAGHPASASGAGQAQ